MMDGQKKSDNAGLIIRLSDDRFLTNPLLFITRPSTLWAPKYCAPLIITFCEKQKCCILEWDL